MHSLLILRTHRVGDPERRTIEALRPYFKSNIVIAADSRNGTLETDLAPVVPITDAILDGWGMRYPSDWGWRCGDFFFYAAAEVYPAYKHYWIVEPDVLFHNIDTRAFFEHMAHRSEDFIAHSIGARTRNWKHYDAIHDRYPNVFGCIFPLVRLSRPTISFLHDQRIAYGQAWDGTSLFANDEGFVTSAIGSNPALTYADLRKLAPKELAHRDFNTKNIFIEGDGLRQGILHPVLTKTEFQEKGFRKIGNTASLDHYSKEVKKLAPDANLKFFQRATKVLATRHLLPRDAPGDLPVFENPRGDFAHAFVRDTFKNPTDRPSMQHFRLSPPMWQPDLPFKEMLPYASSARTQMILAINGQYDALPEAMTDQAALRAGARTACLFPVSALDQTPPTPPNPIIVFAPSQVLSTLGDALSARGCVVFTNWPSFFPDDDPEAATPEITAATVSLLCHHSAPRPTALLFNADHTTLRNHLHTLLPNARSSQMVDIGRGAPHVAEVHPWKLYTLADLQNPDALKKALDQLGLGVNG